MKKIERFKELLIQVYKTDKEQKEMDKIERELIQALEKGEKNNG